MANAGWIRKSLQPKWILIWPAGLGLLWLLAAASLGPKVGVWLPTRGPLVQKIVASGRVYVRTRVQLGCKVGGIVARVLAREGDRVQAGDVVLELENAQETAGVASAAAELQKMREVDTRTAEEDLRQAEVTLDQARRQFDRTQSLYQSEAPSKQDLEDAQKSLDLARSHRESAAANLRSLQAGGSAARHAEAGLSQAEAALAATRITAPAAGTILHRHVEAGDAVQPGQLLLELAKEGETLLSIQPEEKNLGFLRIGQKATASADAFPDRTFPAEVLEIAPAIDPARGTVEVRLRVPDPPDYLRPDMTVSVNVEAARNENALVLPADAVREPDSAAPWVLVVRGGRTARQPVTLGLRGEGKLEILTGLREGEPVVPPSAARVRPGQRVRPKPAPPSTVALGG